MSRPSCAERNARALLRQFPHVAPVVHVRAPRPTPVHWAASCSRPAIMAHGRHSRKGGQSEVEAGHRHHLAVGQKRQPGGGLAYPVILVEIALLAAGMAAARRPKGFGGPARLAARVRRNPAAGGRRMPLWGITRRDVRYGLRFPAMAAPPGAPLRTAGSGLPGQRPRSAAGGPCAQPKGFGGLGAGGFRPDARGSLRRGPQGRPPRRTESSATTSPARTRPCCLAPRRPGLGGGILSLPAWAVRRKKKGRPNWRGLGGRVKPRVG